MSVKRAVYVASAAIIPLSFLYEWSARQEVQQHVHQSMHSESLLPIFLFFALFPGMIARMAFWNAGVVGQEVLAPMVGAAMNIVAYSLLFLGAAKLFRRFMSNRRQDLTADYQRRTTDNRADHPSKD